MSGDVHYTKTVERIRELERERDEARAEANGLRKDLEFAKGEAAEGWQRYETELARMVSHVDWLRRELGSYESGELMSIAESVHGEKVIEDVLKHLDADAPEGRRVVRGNLRAVTSTIVYLEDCDGRRVEKDIGMTMVPAFVVYEVP